VELLVEMLTWLLITFIESIWQRSGEKGRGE
jgi:hypothetical protein